MTNIHCYDKRLKRAIMNVQTCHRISSKNKSLMIKFIEYERAQGTSAGRCAKILWTIKKFAISKYERRGQRSKDNIMMKDFELLDKSDIQREFSKLESSTLKQSTKRDYKILVRFFVGWVFHEKNANAEVYDPKEHGYPSFFKGIRIKESKETIKPSDLLTDKEKQKMIDAAKNLRDKSIDCLSR